MCLTVNSYWQQQQQQATVCQLQSVHQRALIGHHVRYSEVLLAAAAAAVAAAAAIGNRVSGSASTLYRKHAHMHIMKALLYTST
jgi:hypothetical protein